MTDCCIGVDMGTSGCRAMAIDADGRPIAEFAVSMPPPVRRADGASTQDPAIWWMHLLRCLTGLGERLGDLRPRALSLDATATSLLLTSEDGEPLSEALMYDDGRASVEASGLSTVAPPEAPVHGASSSLAKLLFLLQHHSLPPGTRVLHQADWLLGRLCGAPGFSDWNNCLRLGYDPKSACWPDWIDALDLKGVCLPKVTAPGSPVGELRADLARPTGLPEDLVICAGTTDSTAAVLATGVSEPGDGVTVLGSTLVIKLLSTEPINAAKFGVYSHRIGDLWLAGGASNSGGAVLRQFFDDQSLSRLSKKMHPERPTGLDYYPLPRPGERFPRNAPNITPKLTPRPADNSQFLQGMLEGMAAIESEGYRLLESLGAPKLRRVLSIGGGAKNPQWRRIRERLLGVPVELAEQQQAAYGTALLARAGMD